MPGSEIIKFFIQTGNSLVLKHTFMKSIYFYLSIIVLLFISSSIQATDRTSTKEAVIISGTKFTYPLIEKWIAEYTKLNQDVKIQINPKLATGHTADLTIVAHQPGVSELNQNQELISAAKYALLPVTNTNNPILNTAKRGLTKKEIDKLFFEVVDYDAEPTIEKPKFRATIYARDNKACSSNALANYFGRQTTEIRGKKVLGDDIYLLSAVKKDSIGLAYNNLNYLYDTSSRKLKDGIALLPLDLKKDVKGILTANLDHVIDILEKVKIETIPVETISFVYSNSNLNKEVSGFLKWVLTEGQKYNHEKGFLNLDKQTLAEQTNRLNDKFLTSK